MISFEKVDTLKGEVCVPPDKSITHRAFILAGMACGVSKIVNPLLSRDTKATLNAMKMVGVEFEKIDNGFVVKSNGFKNFIEPDDVINCENSGTTARLLTGLFAGQNKYFVLTGDNSLRKRPMDRVIKPLSKLNASIFARSNGKYLPLTILPKTLSGAHIESEVKSAQVKSATILAALQASSHSTYVEKTVTRNHTELMLKSFGVDLSISDKTITINPVERLRPAEIYVPGDFSSAAFFLGASIMFEGSEILIKNTGLNPTRSGMLKILEQSGVKYEILNTFDEGDPYGDIFIKHQKISGGVIKGEIIANIIDEIPIIAALGLFATSPIEIRDAKELRVKESDRIKSIVHNLKELNAEVIEYEDGLKVYPLKDVNKNAKLKSFDDHRIAMVNILLSKRFGNISIDDISSIDVSFPDFLEKLSRLEIKI
jgi:3-phosphoshikimate 1-carboxyvinyltransferase